MSHILVTQCNSYLPNELAAHGYMLLLTGILTQGVVLSTLRHASDMDYRAVVVADGCSDKDPEVQRVLMEKIFPFQARVATVEEIIGALL